MQMAAFRKGTRNLEIHLAAEDAGIWALTLFFFQFHLGRGGTPSNSLHHNLWGLRLRNAESDTAFPRLVCEVNPCGTCVDVTGARFMSVGMLL